MFKDVYVIVRDYRVEDSAITTDIIGIETTKKDVIIKTLRKAEKFWHKLLKDSPGTVTMKVYDAEDVRVKLFGIGETFDYYYFQTKIEIPD